MQPQEIEKRLNLKRIDNLEDLKTSDSPNSYVCDEQGGVIGLNLCGQGLTDDKTSFLWEMADLQVLNVSGNKLSVVAIPADMKALSYLNLSENASLKQVTLAPDLSKLEEVDLSECGLVEFTLPAGLKALKKLILQKNKLTKIIFAGPCPNLEMLDLIGNQLTSLTVPGGFDRLAYLYLIGNQLATLEFKANLPALQDLNVNDNQLQRISFPAGFDRLVTLNAQKNKLADIGSMAKLTGLQNLDLKDNAVTDIGPLKAIIEKGVSVNWDKGNGIKLENNPLSTPPLEIVRQGREAVLNYFQELTVEGTARIREAKMLILGEGGAGKTSLVVRMKEGMEAELPKETESTKGIDIHTYSFIVGPNENFKINIWDFGGQEIYHATHQFFLTKRSLYVLVTDVRKDDTDFNYWLQIIELLSDNSPVLIFQNQKGGRRKDVNEKGLLSRFGNIKNFFYFDLKEDGKGLEKLRKEVEHQVQGLPHVNEVLPKSWADVRKEIDKIKEERENPQSRQHYYIGDYKFFAICNEYGLDEDRARFLSQYLHDLGVFLHFQEDPILKRWVFLSNEWVTEGVYAILDNEYIIDRKGRFSHNDATKILTGRYSGMHDELLELMTKFELCYRIPDLETKEYIAPQLLTANEPKLEWGYTDNLQLLYRYQFMPKGLLSRFIVRLHRHIQDTEREAWKTGVVLHRLGAQAKVVETYGLRNIHIHVKGPNARELLTIIAEEIDNLNGGYHNLKVEKLVPCNCLVCRKLEEPNFYEYADLMRRKERGKTTVECNKSYEDVNVLRLLDNVFVTTFFAPKPVKVFISYSQKDKLHLANLKKQLAILQRQGALLTWDDSKLQPGEKWDNRIRGELLSADLILLLVSPDLLATDYIWEVEMKMALDQHERGETQVVPIIIRPCLWESTPFAKYTALPAKGKPVTTWTDQDDAWDNVARTLKEMTLKLNA